MGKRDCMHSCIVVYLGFCLREGQKELLACELHQFQGEGGSCKCHPEVLCNIAVETSGLDLITIISYLHLHKYMHVHVRAFHVCVLVTCCLPGQHCMYVRTYMQ